MSVRILRYDGFESEREKIQGSLVHLSNGRVHYRELNLGIEISA